MCDDEMRTLSKKQAAVLVSVLVIVAGVGVYWVYESTRTEFHFEEAYPAGDTRKVILVIAEPRDANLTISFENDTSLLYRVDAELYDAQSGSVRMQYDEVNVHSLHLYCEGRQRRIDIVLGTATWYDVTIWRGENLNTTIRFGNGAVLNETWFDVGQTGILRIAVDEHDGLVTHGGMLISARIPRGSDGPLYVLLDIDLPEGYEGRLRTNYAPISFIERVGWGYYGKGIYATAETMKDPWIAFGFTCTSIVARLID